MFQMLLILRISGIISNLITDDSIASFDKSSKTITAKGVEGTTDLIIKTENEEQRVIIEVSKPKITIKGVN